LQSGNAFAGEERLERDLAPIHQVKMPGRLAFLENQIAHAVPIQADGLLHQGQKLGPQALPKGMADNDVPGVIHGKVLTGRRCPSLGFQCLSGL